jgi:hypothetical protein
MSPLTPPVVSVCSFRFLPSTFSLCMCLRLSVCLPGPSAVPGALPFSPLLLLPARLSTAAKERCSVYRSKTALLPAHQSNPSLQGDPTPSAGRSGSSTLRDTTAPVLGVRRVRGESNRSATTHDQCHRRDGHEGEGIQVERPIPEWAAQETDPIKGSAGKGRAWAPYQSRSPLAEPFPLCVMSVQLPPFSPLVSASVFIFIH